MKSRIAIYSVALAAFLVLTGCGSLKRVGKDIAVVVTSPATIPLNATYDALDWGEDTGTATSMLLAPINVPLHLIKHVGYTALYAADMVGSPFYLLASITERNDLEPIDVYHLNHGFPWQSAPWPVLED